jgi:hypothetical protein
VEGDADLDLVVPDEVLVGCNVEQVVRRQPPVRVRLEIVRGDVMLQPPRAGAEDARLVVVRPVGETRERDQGVARAAVAQVDLDGVR